MWSKYWSFSISPSNEYSGLISFRIDRFDLAVQGILKILFQLNSSKASVLQHSAFFMVQLSHLYMTTGKTIALTRWTFVSRVMALLSDTLSYVCGVCVYTLILPFATTWVDLEGITLCEIRHRKTNTI